MVTKRRGRLPPSATPRKRGTKAKPAPARAKKAATPALPSPAAKPQASAVFPYNPWGFTDVHVLKAINYAKDVVDGKIPACKEVKQACNRQLNDLADRNALGNFHTLYFFDEERAGKICRFIERLPHIKGPKANAKELIVLEPWQCFILTTTFGWLNRSTGGRRFRRAYTEVPRGNGKSAISSGVGLYCMTSDGEEGAEVYSAATTRDQAKIVWGDAYKMLKKRPDFCETIGAVIPRTEVGGTLHHPRTNSKFEPLSRESSNMDGKNLHLGIIDELHAHKDRGIYDVLETAMGKRLSSLLWVITTAGTDTSGICYEVRSYCKKVLQGTVEDDSQFAIIYTIDEGDEWTELATWVKANPNWGVSVMPDVVAQLAKKAMTVLSAQNNFKTKHLNIWCNADLPWLDLQKWDLCGDPTLALEQFMRTEQGDGAPCHEGLDLATKTDIVAKTRVFTRWLPPWKKGACVQHTRAGAWRCPTCYPPDEDRTEKHYFVFLEAYLPEAAVEEGRNASYEGWALEGRLITTPGDVTDFATIKAGITEDLDNFNLREVPYDPWQCAQLAQELQELGVNMMEFRATVGNFSEPMKEWESLMLQGRLHHDTNTLLRWMVSNVVCHRDAKENVFPRKERPENKIDGVVAGIMALARALAEDDPYAAGGGFKSL